MRYIYDIFTSGQYSEAIILTIVFVTSVSLFYFAYLFLWPSMDVARRASTGSSGVLDSEILRVLVPDTGHGDEAKLQAAIETFYASLQVADPNAISRRLIRAGYFNQSALYYFYAVRVILSLLTFVGTYFLVQSIVEDLSVALTAYVAAGAALIVLIVPNFILDRMGTRQEERYRRSFPDFMDILIVCADAGLSLEAAVARVAKEMLMTNREFGIHLHILVLEVRAGKRLREALTSFADRLVLDEARSLATVFKQSEELGSSLTHTLRVFSHEMRRARITRAEEKANALPVKMIFPLGLFIFPVMLTVVLFPVLLTLFKLVQQNMPN